VEQFDVAAEAATHKDYFDGATPVCVSIEMAAEGKNCHSERSEESLFDFDSGAKPKKERFFVSLRMTTILLNCDLATGYSKNLSFIVT